LGDYWEELGKILVRSGKGGYGRLWEALGGYGRIFMEVRKISKENKRNVIQCRLSEEDAAELDMASYLDDMSRSEYVRRALRVYCNLRKHAPEVLKEYERSMNDGE
jgi:hypothetical protein